MKSIKSSIQVFKNRVYKLVTHYTLHIITYNVKTRDPIGSKNTITWKITEMTRESVRTQMKKTSSSLFSARAARWSTIPFMVTFVPKFPRAERDWRLELPPTFGEIGGNKRNNICNKYNQQGTQVNRQHLQLLTSNMRLVPPYVELLRGLREISHHLEKISRALGHSSCLA